MARYQFKKNRTPETKGSLKNFDNIPLGLLGKSALAPITIMKFIEERNKRRIPRNKKNKRKFK
tara:strand:- start:78 stop:266 length:189 start_codon:yes stop_codon:yes gene_type:complete